MNVTFLIGNGFDLRLGMKTRFTHMYEGYIAQKSSLDVIQKFKAMLEKDAPNYRTWGDFEMAMAEKAKEFPDEDSFIECLRDFKLYMVLHLENEQKIMDDRMAAGKNTRDICAKEVLRSIEQFYSQLSPNTVNIFSRLGAKDHPTYNFISFNYTSVFDSLLPVYVNAPVHIHGKLGADVVLGADNLDQVKDLPYVPSRRFNCAFIKPEFNKNYDIARFAKAERILDSSNIICVYGMSLGKSDLTWVRRLKEWLLSHKDNHLVYFIHDEQKFNKSNWDAIIDEEEDRIATLLGKMCDSGDEMDKLFRQVHIPVGYDIFDINQVLKAEKDKADYEAIKREAIRKKNENRPQELGV